MLSVLYPLPNEKKALPIKGTPAKLYPLIVCATIFHIRNKGYTYAVV